MLVSSKGIEHYISGIIFQEETAKQSNSHGVKFVDYATKLGIVPGIKVDKGLAELN
jgi:fructose-bisphosphate aldolase class I